MLPRDLVEERVQEGDQVLLLRRMDVGPKARATL